MIMKKLYKKGCRNILVEGGNDLTKFFLKYKIFNSFYLFESSKILSKKFEFKEFDAFNILKKNYKKRSNMNIFLKNDKLTLYRQSNV